MRRILQATAFALLLPLVSCDRGPTQVELDVEGTYTLQSVNGQPLPFTLATAGADRLEIVSGSITLERNGTFEDRALFRLTEAGEVEELDDTITGTYVQNGSNITMTASDGETYSLLLEGDRLTQVLGQFTLVYRK